MATQLTAVPYFGGKARIRLHDWIQSHLDKGQIYVEPFAGALSILLNRERSYFECANDLDGNVVNFFRCLRDHGGELLEKLRLTPISREEFVHCQHTLEHNEPDDIEQARCWYVLVHQSRAGAFAHRWKASKKRRLDEFANRVDYILPLIVERIRRVQFENRDAVELVAKYADDPDTVIYCDPPYPKETRGSVGDYRLDTSDDLHDRLLDAVTQDDVHAQVVISTYDSDRYRERLAGWHRAELEVVRHAADGSHKGTEVLYANRLPRRKSLDLF